MKFSIVIPTRNRLKLLKYALTSILRQKYTDWEVIVSDNASTEDIQSYVDSLNEPRIKYSRSDRFLSITDSWNRAMELSSGDYILMIGDDDILLDNYFQIAQTLIEKYKQPELIYTNAFLYAYPHVIPEFPQGLFQPFGSLHAMPKKEVPFWLDPECKKEILQAMLQFRAIYSTNMQHGLIRRSLFEKTKRKGYLFYSSYPDIYAMNALFYEAKEILIYPHELVVIGISTYSHGFFAINKKEQEALDFLNAKKEMEMIESLRDIIEPGSMVYTYWLGAIELFKLHFPIEQMGLHVDYTIYQRAQHDYRMAMDIQSKKIETWRQLLFLWKQKLRGISLYLLRFCPFFFIKWVKKISSRPSHTYTELNPPPAHFRHDVGINQFETILEIFEKVLPIDCSNR